MSIQSKINCSIDSIWNGKLNVINLNYYIFIGRLNGREKLAKQVVPQMQRRLKLTQMLQLKQQNHMKTLQMARPTQQYRPLKHYPAPVCQNNQV